MSDRLRNYVFINLNQKETDELVAIWKKHDEKEWTEPAFDAIREILQDRQVELPPHDEPGTEPVKRRFRAEVDALTDIGELERRIADRETLLLKVKNRKTATLVTLIAGSVSLVFCGFSRILDTGVYGIVLSAVALALFVGLYAWRISRDTKQERQLQSELDEYRDKKAELEASLTVEE